MKAACLKPLVAIFALVSHATVAQDHDPTEPYWYAAYREGKCALWGAFDRDFRNQYVFFLVSEPDAFETVRLVFRNSSSDMSGEYVFTSGSLQEPWRIPVRDELELEGANVDALLADLLRGDTWSFQHQTAPGRAVGFKTAVKGSRASAKMFEACRAKARTPQPAMPEWDFSYAPGAGVQEEPAACRMEWLYSVLPVGASITIIGDQKGISVETWSGREKPTKIDMAPLHGPASAKNVKFRLPAATGMSLLHSLIDGKMYGLPYAKGESTHETLLLGGYRDHILAAMFGACMDAHALPEPRRAQ